MGKLIDHDYLWLQQAPPPRRTATRLLSLITIALAAIGGGSYYITVADTDVDRPSIAITPADSAIDAGPPAEIAAAGRDSTARYPARAYPAVAHAPAGGLIAISQVIGSNPDAVLDDAVRRFAAEPSSAQPTRAWRDVDIEPGDTLSIAFGRHGLSYMDSLDIAHLSKYGSYFTRELKDGDRMRVKADRQGHVEALDYPLDALRTLEIRRDDGRFSGRIISADVERRRAYTTGVITTSFYANARAAGLNDRQILKLNHIFAWDIDFGQDIQPGDRFVAVYDELYRDGRKVGNSSLLAAAFINKNHEYRALRFADGDGDAHYYTPAGQPMRKAFVRAPVDYTRISSPFNLARLHPILHRIRRHEGTDYAAPMNTPIHATGDGRIIFQGRRGGYGNMVIIRHSADITMRFGHMSRFARGLHTGSRVSQGQVIGYVGMTGLATGPHVHYEFRVDGKPRNPQTVRLPGVAPLSGSQLAAFRRHASPLMAQLDHMTETTVAQVGDTQIGKSD
jgi:murein DD-endopeptidase MepM/ murein hydrolase activator NlpD